MGLHVLATLECEALRMYVYNLCSCQVSDWEECSTFNPVQEVWRGTEQSIAIQ